MKIKAVFFTFLFLSAGMVSSKAWFRSPGPPLAKQGILDLRQQSFEEKIPMDGDWAFYWQQLVDPVHPASGTPVFTSFPFLWTNYIKNGKNLPSFGYASYRLTVLLPETEKQLRISMPDAYCAYALYVNGRLSAANGKVTTSARDFVPHWQYRAFDIPKGTDTLQLLLQISNFAHSKAGMKKSIVIGEKSGIELTRQRSAAIDLMLTGCLFMGGLFFLGLFLLGSRDRAILLFSLYSMVYSYRIIGVDNYVLHTILPQLNWYITVRMEYISLFLGIGLFGLYTRYLYPEDVSKKAVVFVSLLCFSFAGCSLVWPPISFTRLINPFLVIMLLCIIYTPYVYFRAYQKKRPGAVYALCSSAVLMPVFTISLLYYWGMIPQLQVVSFAGYICFFFLQSLVLSHRVSFLLKKAKAQAEEGLRAKSEFLSTMSHEIRTPLNSVVGMSHILLSSNPREDQQNQLNVMLFSANHLLAIVNDILDYNKIEAGKISFESIGMDFASIAANVVTGLKGDAEKKGITLDFHVDTALQDRVKGDPTRTFQVLNNLVHNAIKFTQQGFVAVSIEVKEETEKYITLKIQVRDTGIGISPENQRVIFDRFTQADSSTSRGFGGTGLGLAICKRILELQGSKLQLSSKAGRGSIFYFTQIFEKSTISHEEPAQEHLGPLLQDKPLTGVAILLVEDNPMNVMVAQNFLKSWGAAVDVAVNGQEALDKLDRQKHHLILMDLHMPVMDGYESSKRMRADGVTTPIVALTANLPSEIEAEVKISGINDIVIKPFLPEELCKKILKYI